MTSITWLHGVSGDWTTAADWSTGTVPGASDGVTINAAGTYTVTLFSAAAVGSMTLNAPGATFYDSGSLALGGTLSVQSGTLALAYGSLVGGTLAMAGGTLLAGGGLLDGVSVQGTLDLSRANASLSVRDGMVLSGTGGSGAGSISLTGGYADLGYQGSQTLDHAVVTIGAASVQPGQGGAATLGVTHLSNATSGATLTLGTGLWLHEAGGQAALSIGALGQLNGPQLPDEMLNLGTITCDSAGSTLTVAGSGTLVNQGTIAISGGATLDLDEAGLTNTGHISVNNGTLGLGGTFSASRLGGLGNLTLSQATLEIVGTADNTGGTLTVGTSGLGPITLAGTILNGIVLDTGGGLLFGPATGILDGATYQGTLSLAAARSAVTLTDGASVISAGGGAGTIAVTGAGSALLLRGIDTLDNATISLGSAGSAAVIGTNDAFLASTATTATLGAHLSVIQAGLYAALDANAWSPIPNFGLSDTLVNQGAISAAVAGGMLSISGYGTFVNQGTIAVSNGDSLAVTAVDFANAGTLSIGGGASATLGAGGGGYTPVWSNSGLISVNGGTLTLAGAMQTSQLGSITVAAGSVTLAGTLSNAGSTLTLGAGAHGPGSLAAASLTGTIQGGTVVDSTGALAIGAGGTALLDGVSYQGSLSLTQAGAYLRVRDGLSLTGTAAVTGAGSVLAFQGTQSFDHAHVLLGASGSAASIDVVHDYGGQGGSTLTLGAGLGIVQTGALASIGLLGDAPVDAIVNLGSISGAVSGGMLSIGGADFINQGVISVSNGDTLSLAAARFSNTGTIGVSNASLSIAGSTTLAGLGHLVLSNAAVSVSGTLDSTGTTLAIGTGTAIGRLGLSGTLRGGTILDTGSGLGCVGAALLDGVAYRGTLDLSRPFAQLSLADGIVLSDISGTQPGSVLLTGAASRIVTTTSQTLDNATIMIGAPATQYGGQRLPAPELAAAATTTLTLGAHAVVRSAAAYGTIGDSALGRWTDAIVNDGQILSSIALGTLTLGSSFFTNAGTIAVAGGGGVLDASTGFTNTGTISVGAGSNFWISLYDYFAAPNAGATVFTNAGTIQMQGGLVQELTAGGLFPPVPIANQAGGLIQGTGIVFSQIVNSGTIESHGGALALLQSITGGSGALLIDPNSTLEFGNAVPVSEVVTFTDTGTGGVLKLDQPSNFAAPIAGYTTGDLIELPGVQLTSVGNAGGTLVASSATHTWRFPTTTLLAGAFSAGRDARGDATIAITPQTLGGPQAVLSDYQPGMLFWCSPVGDEFQGVTANLNGASIGNWSAADSLDLTDMAFGSAHLAYSQGSNAGTLTLSDGTHTALVSLTGSFPGAGFHLAADGHGGTLVTYTHP